VWAGGIWARLFSGKIWQTGKGRIRRGGRQGKKDKSLLGGSERRKSGGPEKKKRRSSLRGCAEDRTGMQGPFPLSFDRAKSGSSPGGFMPEGGRRPSFSLVVHAATNKARLGVRPLTGRCLGGLSQFRGADNNLTRCVWKVKEKKGGESFLSCGGISLTENCQWHR